MAIRWARRKIAAPDLNPVYAITVQKFAEWGTYVCTVNVETLKLANLKRRCYVVYLRLLHGTRGDIIVGSVTASYSKYMFDSESATNVHHSTFSRHNWMAFGAHVCQRPIWGTRLLGHQTDSPCKQQRSFHACPCPRPRITASHCSHMLP